MAMFFNPRKLAGEGLPGITPDAGVADYAAQAPMVAPQPMPQPKGLPRWAGIALDVLAGAGGRRGAYGDAMMARQQREMELADQQRQQAQQWAFWQAQQDYKAAHPEAPSPTALERNVAYYRSIGRDDLADSYLANSANPIQGVPITNPDGSSGIQFIRPGAMGGAPAAPQRPVGKLTPIQGGPTQPASAGFR